MTADTDFDFRRGGEEAEKASAAKKNTTFARTNYFGLEKDKDSAVVRFITDEPDWYTVSQHLFIVTRAKPSDWPEDRNWPSMMSATCRMEPAFKGKYSDCFICDNLRNKWGKPAKGGTERLWALLCLREPVVKDGVVIGYKDKTIDIEETDKDGKPTGQVLTVKDIQVANFAWDNFFGNVAPYKAEFGTLLDRDFKIVRKGTGTDTDYIFMPQAPTGRDLRDPETAAKYKTDISLPALIASRASDDYYDLFFDTRHPQPSRSKDGDPSGGVPTEQQAKPANEMSADETAKREKMKGRLQAYREGGGEGDAPDTTEATTEAQAPVEGGEVEKVLEPVGAAASTEID